MQAERGEITSVTEEHPHRSRPVHPRAAAVLRLFGSCSNNLSCNKASEHKHEAFSGQVRRKHGWSSMYSLLQVTVRGRYAWD